MRSILVVTCLACALVTTAAASTRPAEPGYPRLLIHNFGIKPPMSEEQIEALARRDLIVLAPIFRKDYDDVAAIRKINPRIRILAYAMTFQAAFDEAAWLSNEDEAALFRPSGDSWLVGPPVARLAGPAAAKDDVLTLRAADATPAAGGDLPVLLCGDELLRVTKVGPDRVTVVRGHCGTTARDHPAGAPVTRVMQPPWATRVYRKRSPRAEVLDINISDTAPRVGGRQPWEIKAAYLEQCWADPRWRRAFDGFFLDEGQVIVMEPKLDLNRDGTADTAAEVHGGLQRGLRAICGRLRQRCGDDMLLVLNNNADLIPELNGRHREHFVDVGAGDALSEAVGRWNWAPHTWANGTEPLRAWADVAREPAVLINTSQPGRWDDYRQVRLGLASAVLFDGYFQYRARSGDSRNWQHWYDEYGVDRSGNPTTDPAGLHWLGKPLGPARQRVRELASPNLLCEPAGWALRVGDAPAEARAADVEFGKRVAIRKVGTPDPSAVMLGLRGTAPLQPGREYTLGFEARATTPRLVDASVRAANGSADAAKVHVPLYVRNRWERTVITCVCQSNKPLAGWELALEMGRDSGDVEFRNVTWREGTAEIGWTREFEHGMAVVNPTRRPQNFDGLTGFRKLRGHQDAGHNDGARIEGRLTVPPSDAYLLQRVVGGQ